MSLSTEQTRKNAEVPRKALHLLVAAFPLLALRIGRSSSLVIVLALAVTAIAADVLRWRSTSFEKWIQRLFGFMMRPAEEAQERLVINGATWVLVSFAILVLVFPFVIGSGSLFVFILADAFAAIVGRRFGRHRWPRSERTLEGSIAFTVAGFVAAAFFPGMDLAHAVVAVIAGAAAEVPRGPLNDNVRVPVVIAVVLTLIDYVTIQ